MIDKLQEIRKYTEMILAENGKNDWNFVFDKAVKRYGQCRHTRKQISISKQLTELNTIERTKRTVLHEVGHAIAGRGNGHNAYWKKCCRDIGLKNPKRTYSDIDTIPVKLKYAYKCISCGNIRYYSRKRVHQFSCGACDNKYNPNYEMMLINKGEI